MKYSLIASFVLAAIQVAARPQDAPTPAKGGCSLNEVLIGELNALDLKTKGFLIFTARGTSESGPYGFSK
jgi:hypothetical protein